VTGRLKLGIGQKQVIEDARSLEGILNYITTQSSATVDDLVMTQNLEQKPVSRLLKMLANAGIVEKTGKRQWVLATKSTLDPKHDAYKIALEAASWKSK